MTSKCQAWDHSSIRSGYQGVGRDQSCVASWRAALWVWQVLSSGQGRQRPKMIGRFLDRSSLVALTRAGLMEG